ncbi:glycosyltransferase family 2 protein [Chromobacterium amazonense]|nr:glycosyltransferase family A protein [Chromobacterium amazonense]
MPNILENQHNLNTIEIIKLLNKKKEIKKGLEVHEEDIEQITALIETEKSIVEHIVEKKIKSHLSYRIGNLLIKPKSPFDFVFLPLKIINEYKAYKAEKRAIAQHSGLLKKQKINLSVKKNQIINGKKTEIIFNSVNQNLRKYRSSKSKEGADKDLILRLVFNKLNKISLQESWKIGFSIIAKTDHHQEFIDYIAARIKNSQEKDVEKVIVHFYEISLFVKNEPAISVAESIIQNNFKERTIRERASLAAKILPLLLCYKTKDKIEWLTQSLDVSLSRLADTDEFIKSFIKQPLAFSELIPENFELILQARLDSYEAIYAKFLHQIIYKKTLSEEVVNLFFQLKEKYKTGLIMSIRRLDLDCVKIELDNNSLKIIRKISTENDLILCAMLFNIPDKETDSISKKLKLNSHSTAIQFLRSRLGDNRALIESVNATYKKNNLSEIDIQCSSSNLLSLYSNIVNNTPFKEGYSSIKYQVSVVMTTYNPDIQYLKIAIDSIVKQNYVQTELIIVDDHSENSREIENITKNYRSVRYFKNETNNGTYKSRNKAIDLCKYSIITFQDDDDISHPDRLYYQCKELEKTGASIVAVSHIRFNEQGRVQIDSGCKIKSDGPVTMLFNKSIFDKIGKFSEVRSRGDVEFRSRSIRILGKDAFVQQEIPLYFSKGSMNNLSSIFEYGIDYPKLALQRKIIEVKNDE